MSDSILTSIKKLLGIAENYEFFDADVIMNINMAFMVLYQLGVGPSTAFSITDKSATWSDFLGDATDLEGVKTYIFLKVKRVFDPPQSSAAMEAIKQSIDELEWRLNAAVDPRETFTVDEDGANAYALSNRSKITAFEKAASRL